MKKVIVFAGLLLISLTAFANETEVSLFEVVGGHDGPVIKKGDPGTENNKYGFEGGRAFKLKGVYHLFTAERAGEPKIVKMRLAHWKSKDGISWERVSTLYESSGDFTGKDPRASLWSPMPFYNEKEGRWNIFYVAYKAKPNTEDAWYLNHEGRIWRAVSKTPGMDGLDGPYKDVGIVLEPGSDSDPWEGLQGTDSFYVYPVGGKWYGFYGSANTHKIPCDFWGVGLVSAPEMAGPWKRCSELNPVDLKAKFAENPVVIQMDDGSYIAMVDGGSKIGYITSKDGIHWSGARFIKLDPKIKKWWTHMRTPLSLIKEKDGTFTVFFTAYTETEFACVGMTRLKLKTESATTEPAACKEAKSQE